MKAKRILTLMIVLLIVLACQLPGATLGELPDGTTAPPAATLGQAPAAPLLITGDTPEPPAGAVYEIPTYENKLCATVTALEALHLRAKPNEKAEVLDYLYNGEQVRVVTPGGGWWKVKTAAGKTGFAKAKYLQEEKCQ